MTTFHRYVTPGYHGGLPAGYDLINVVSGSIGGDGGAFADGPKTGGPNNGTYFVGFDDDATSSNANRGFRALSQNCDALDDYLHRDIAVAQRTTDVTPGSPVTSIVLPTDTYLGSSAYTSSTADLARLYSVVDSNDEEIIDSAGSKVVVASVTLGTGDQIGGGGANGSFSGNTVQLNLAPAIPTGTAYRIYYGTRANLATLPSDALVTIKIRGAEEVSAPVEDNFLALRGDGLAWNASWPTTVEALALGGIHQRYMRATTVSIASGDVPPEFYWPDVALDTSGSGGFFIRRGPSLTGYANDAGPYVDPLNALFSAKFFDHAVNTAANSTGAVGMAVYGGRRSAVGWFGEDTSHVPGSGSFAHLWPHYFAGSLSTTQPKTRVINATAALFSLVGSYDMDAGEAIVQLTASNNYFRSGGVSAINLGYDLLECFHTVGIADVCRTYVIVGHGSSATPTDVTKVRVRNLDGTVPDFTTPVTGRVKWISTTMWMGDGAAEYHAQAHTDVKPSLLSGLFYQVPPVLSVGGAQDDIPRTPASLSASSIGVGFPALKWGGFNETDSVSSAVFSGSLNGDGSATLKNVSTATGDIVATGTTNAQGAIIGNYILRTLQSVPGIDSPFTATLNCANGSFFHCTAAVNGQLITLNMTNVRAGGCYEFYLNYSTFEAGSITLSWGGAGLTHRFAPSDDQPLPGVGRSLWVGRAVSATEILWTVTHYN